jgi:hypothetical protein
MDSFLEFVCSNRTNGWLLVLIPTLLFIISEVLDNIPQNTLKAGSISQLLLQGTKILLQKALSPYDLKALEIPKKEDATQEKEKK